MREGEERRRSQFPSPRRRMPTFVGGGGGGQGGGEAVQLGANVRRREQPPPQPSPSLGEGVAAVRSPQKRAARGGVGHPSRRRSSSYPPSEPGPRNRSWP